ncbi:GNAT family N-acetyltransferase [uncultured Psychrobacter sp.]|uniref:GNAT family N-acetyltransferase n=1 Tax=uncultured Psychrobacter sp. TaxID=259303 RepID=UPI003459805E
MYGNFLVVRSKYQGMGFAKKLIFYLFDVADSQNLKIRVDVNPNNKYTFAWYVASSYVPVDEYNHSVLKLDTQNPSPTEFEDVNKYNNFGISNSRIFK